MCYGLSGTVYQKAAAAGPRVVFAGGVTGGHLFPGIAVASELVRRYPDAHVIFAGTGRRMETRVVPSQGFRVERIRGAGLMGKSVVDVARALLLAPVSFVDAARMLRRQRPDLVVGLGGYSAGPVVLLAALRGVPTMVIEQNAVPGMTNRLLARVIRAAAVSFEETRRHFGASAFVSGNPVRAGFFGPRPTVTGTPRRVLVIGGSQGAHAINVAMVEAAAILVASDPKLRITHQTGDRDLGYVRDGYRAAGLEARVEPFLDAMDEEMRSADLAICRAGATTLAEVSAAGLPALLVPLPHAANDHQRHNAAVVAAAGAAEVFEQTDLDGQTLASRLLTLARDDARRRAMSVATRRLARPDAARIVVDRAEQLMELGSGTAYATGDRTG